MGTHIPSCHPEVTLPQPRGASAAETQRFFGPALLRAMHSHRSGADNAAAPGKAPAQKQMKNCENSVFAQLPARLQRRQEPHRANSNTNASNLFT